jgi:formylglycine-generating enzyme required for sulfatase activity
MHGNVFEWVEDCWHEDYGEPPRDGGAWLEKNGGDCSRRVLRGGSWNFKQGLARCAFRRWDYPYYLGLNIGFRVVCLSPIAKR